MLATKIRWGERMVGAAIIARRCRKKIKRLSRHLEIVEEPGLKAAVRSRFNGYSCDLWHKAYAAVSGRSSVDYVPEDIFYNVFETRLNPRHRREPYADKNFFDRLDWPCLPETIFRIINGRLFDRSYRMIDSESALTLAHNTGLSEFVVKPARESGSGSQVSFLDHPALASFLPANLKRHSDWIIQRPIIQHEVMASLNASSVNTLRIVTIRMGTEVSVVSAFAKIGTKGKRIDNVSAGNIAIGIEDDGRLKKFGYDFALKRHSAHPDHGYAFGEFVIPSYTAAQQACVGLHGSVPDLDLLSWDVAIDSNGDPVVIEANIRRQDVNITQICNGPVFSPYVDAVLARHKWIVLPGIGAIDRQADMAPEFVRH
jgi:Sugar-transfer associated ATP-grasp